MSSQPLRLGVLGAANIARSFIAATAASPLLKVTAVASRDAAKGAAFVKETGVAKSFASYEAMLASPEIDAVYNPLPNTLHAEWTIKAAAAGKHILCEKPLATSAAEARAMFAAARKNGVHLAEAYPYMAQAQTLKARELIASDAIGKPRLIRASFGFSLSDPANIRMKPDMAGGALMDAGSYAVSLVRILGGECPARVLALARWASTGVDSTIVATLDFKSGLIAQVSASFSTANHRAAQVIGDAGSLETTYLNHPPAGGPAAVYIRRGVAVTPAPEMIEVAGGNGFLAEAESFARLISDGAAHWTGASEQESIDIALTIDALRASARSGGWVDVAA